MNIFYELPTTPSIGNEVQNNTSYSELYIKIIYYSTGNNGVIGGCNCSKSWGYKFCLFL